MAPNPTEADFTEFMENHGPGLRRAFIARCGPEVGTEVMGDVSDYAWEHWKKLSQMDNPSAGSIASASRGLAAIFAAPSACPRRVPSMCRSWSPPFRECSKLSRQPAGGRAPHQSLRVLGAGGGRDHRRRRVDGSAECAAGVDPASSSDGGPK